MPSRLKTEEDTVTFSDARTSAEKLTHLLSDRARGFLMDRVNARSREIVSADSVSAQKIIDEVQHVAISLRDTEKNYIKLVVSYAAATCQISVPTSFADGALRVVAERYVPLVEPRLNEKKEMSLALRDMNKELLEQTLDGCGAKAKREDYTNSIMFIIQANDLELIPEVRLTLEEQLKQAADKTDLPGYILPTANRNLQVARELELFRFRRRTDKLLIAAALVCAYKAGIRGSTDEESEERGYVRDVSAYLGLNRYVVRHAAEELRFKKERRY